MLQGVVDTAKRGELGMHYTSPTNIMKVLGPILLDDLRSALDDAGIAKEKLHVFLTRLRRVRVFHPACGSGNFLIIAYKALRAMEMEAFKRLGELPHDVVELDEFYGLEIDDFACQTARLGLWIAEYQMDELFRRELGLTRTFLPLSQAGRITQGNAATLDWLAACPADEGSETIVVGNPPFKGATLQGKDQKADMARVFKGVLRTWGELDYVAIWFMKGALYAEMTSARFAFVSTNSLVQGVQVASLWPRLLERLEIHFAHKSFKWSNLAAKNAGVTCVVIGLATRALTTKRLYDAETIRDVSIIGPYLAPNTTAIVARERRPAGPVQPMSFGNKPTDGGHLILDRQERNSFLNAYTKATAWIRRLYGTQELTKGLERWCVWVREREVVAARAICPLAARFERVRAFRESSVKEPTQKLSAKPWMFESQNESITHTIVIPGAASEDRTWLPVDVRLAPDITSNLAFAIYDGDLWQAAVLSSRLHRLWLETVGGRLKVDPRYSNTLVWNTFPLPALSEQRKAELEEHWWEIDRARKEAGFGRTLGDLYVPKTMPLDLRRAHEALDSTVERIFGARRYRSDSDRIEHLLQLYEAAVEGKAAR